MIVGVLLAAATAWVFVRRDLVPPAERLEQLALDVGFRGRSPIRESDKIVLVDIDDTTTRRFRWPMERKYFAQALTALDRLGARQIAFDVEFKIIAPIREDFDAETGDYRLKDDDRALRFAIARSGKVTLGFHAEAQDRLPPELQPHLPKLREIFGKNPGAEEEEVLRAIGGTGEGIRGNLERIRDQVVATLVADLMERRPGISFPEVRRTLLPQYSVQRHGRELGILQAAYWQWKALRALEA